MVEVVVPAAEPAAPVAPATPAPATPAAPGTPAAPATPATPAVPAPSIAERVGKDTSTPAAPAAPAVTPFEIDGFNRNDINKITDPNARTLVENAFKSMEAGVTKKFQEASELRKKAESQLAAAGQSQPWTQERLLEALKDPSFINVAKTALGSDGVNIGGQSFTEEEWSALSEGEKATLQKMQSTILGLQRNAYDQDVQRQDDALKGRYSRYDSGEINQLSDDLVNNRVQATREHLYKVLHYDDDLERAYQMGRGDERQGITHKVTTSSSTEPITSTPQEVVPAREENESGPAYFKRLALRRLEQARTRTPAAT